MKLFPQSRKQTRSHGIALIECLIYMALFFVIMMLAYEAHDRVADTSQKLRKGGDDIIASLHVGERWREDIRLAIEEPTIDHETVSIPQTNGAVTYAFREGAVFRRPPTNGLWSKVLSDVRISKMQKDVGAVVTSWRWELELKTRANTPGVKPLFTFESVPGFQFK